MSVLPAALADRLEREYDLGIERANSIQGGDQSLTWRAVSKGNRDVLVHKSPPWRTPEELRYVHRVIDCVRTLLPEAVAPLSAVDGRTFVPFEGSLVTVYPWIDGKHVDPRDGRQRDEAARLLARLHRATTDCDMPSRPTSDGAAPANWANLPDPAALEDRDLDSWHQSCPPASYAGGLIHGDFYRRNLLWSNERIAGVVDWHEARYDVLARELSWSAWEFAKVDEGRRLDAERAGRFLHLYRQADGIAEIADVVLFIRWRLREEARLGLKLLGRGLLHDREYVESQVAAFAGLREVSVSVPAW